MSSSLAGSRLLVPKLPIDSKYFGGARKHSTDLRQICVTHSLKQGVKFTEFSFLGGDHGCKDCIGGKLMGISEGTRCSDGVFCSDVGWALSSSHHATSFTTASTTSSTNAHTRYPHSDSESDSDDDTEFRVGSAQVKQRMELPEEGASSVFPISSQSLEPESWVLTNGDVPMLVSNLSFMERYAPRRLLELITKKLDTQMFSLAWLRSTLIFWQKKNLEEEDAMSGFSAFNEWKGVSQVHQWTATELTLQHARLTRVSRDILYLVLACSLLGFVRVLEAIFATFSTSPPHFSRILEAANSLDFFTMAYLAHSLRKPVVGILRVDPTNLDEVVHLKAKIWDEMHKFFERQWKLVATLGVGRLLALIAQTSPSTNAMTRHAKMCWNFLLALPIF